MKTAVATLVAIMGIGTISLQPKAPPGMEGQDVTVVRYYSGAKWSDFDKYVDAHLNFLRKGMESGKLLYAGPFADDTGGLNIYNTADLAEVDRLVRQDPLIEKGVVTFSMQTWRMCKLAEKKPAAPETAPPTEKPEPERKP